MDREAQAYYDKRDYNQAIGLWLSCLDMEPDNEKIQQKIEMVYEIKQRKDISFQKAKLNYRIARRKLAEENDEEVKRGIAMGKQAIEDYVDAYRIDPNDGDMKDSMDNMKNLEREIRAAEERIRLSEAMRKKMEELKAQARAEMAAGVSRLPEGAEALEGGPPVRSPGQRGDRGEAQVRVCH